MGPFAFDDNDVFIAARLESAYSLVWGNGLGYGSGNCPGNSSGIGLEKGSGIGSEVVWDWFRKSFRDWFRIFREMTWQMVQGLVRGNGLGSEESFGD